MICKRSKILPQLFVIAFLILLGSFGLFKEAFAYTVQDVQAFYDGTFQTITNQTDPTTVYYDYVFSGNSGGYNWFSTTTNLYNQNWIDFAYANNFQFIFEEGEFSTTTIYWNDCGYYYYCNLDPHLIAKSTIVINNGVYSTTTPPTFSTNFTSFTASTSTGTVNIQGYWNVPTASNLHQQLEFYQDSTILGVESYIKVTATTTGNFNFTYPYYDLPILSGSTTTPQITSPIYFYANLYQIDDNYYTDPFTGVANPNYSTLLDATTTSLTGISTLWTLGSTTDVFAYPEYECAITSLTGCFKNALIWAFYPTKNTVQNYFNFQALIQTKAPFGYFSIIKSSLGNLSATGTQAFTITIPKHLKDYIFTPFDVGLASILWFFFAFNFYKRLKHITI
jgi:hypothetical protein